MRDASKPASAGPIISVLVSIAEKNELAGSNWRFETTCGTIENIAGLKKPDATEMSTRSTYTIQRPNSIREGIIATRIARATSQLTRIALRLNRSAMAPAHTLVNKLPMNIDATERETANAERLSAKIQSETAIQ